MPSHHPHYTISTFERVDYCLAAGQTSLLPPSSTIHQPQVHLQQPLQQQHNLEGGPLSCQSGPHLPNAPPIGVLKSGGFHRTSRHMSMTPTTVISDLDRFKLEKKRERNRIAASKCRQRKLERISDLESQVAQLKGDNDTLSRLSDRLNTDIRQLKNQIDSHLRRGCRVEGIPLDGVVPTEFQVETSTTRQTSRHNHELPPHHQQETNPDSTCLS